MRLTKTVMGGLCCFAWALSACSDGGPVSDQAKTGEQTPSAPAPLQTSAPARPAPNPTKTVYFGETHIHTKNSFDAYLMNVRATLDDVYRFALGETLTHPGGFGIALDGPPLDFVAATDHGAYLGVVPAMNDPDSPLSKLDISQGMFTQDPEKIRAAFQRLGGSVRVGEPVAAVYDRDLIDDTWARVIATADKYYRPGELTTFAAYEYTAMTTHPESGDSFGGGNLHRNVFFKDAAPDRLFSALDSPNPEDLWDWMDAQREQGRDSLAIPHNSNVSDGRMFAMTAYDGSPITAGSAAKRLRNEPIVEVTQIKGTSETHPMLSPNDEFANFELYETLLTLDAKGKINGSYVREALANGFGIESKVGVNPFKFGVIGASDSHVAGAGFTESDYWSKSGLPDATPEARGVVPPGGAKHWEGVERNAMAEQMFSRWSASGLAAVWAEENTRESIFNAMRARETYATSGPRIALRVFGGTKFDDEMLSASDMVAQAYARGVPMGGELGGEELGGGEPGGDTAGPDATQLLIHATQDPRSAPLQRVQVIKVWHDGQAQERIWDVACSDGLIPEDGRCPDNGATVDLQTCEYTKGVGAGELKVLWTDPTFRPDQSAAYYVRVLENPTCRWSTWQANEAEVDLHPDRAATLQERAWSSPIWYTAR